MADPTVTDQAIEAAARALFQRDRSAIRRPTWEDLAHSGDTIWHVEARHALAAAVPVLFQALSDEIRAEAEREASFDPGPYWEGVTFGKFRAATLVRSAAGRWQPDA